MPRILLVTRNLPPLRGGMERLNLHLARALSELGELTVIGPEGCASSLPQNTSVVEVPLRPLWRFLLTSFLEARQRAKLEKFHLSIAGSGLTAPIVLHAAYCSRGKSASYVHGLDLLVDHLVYRTLWRPMLRRVDLALANSVSTANIARSIGVARRRVEIVHPGVTLPNPSIEKDNDFRARHSLGDGPLLLSVGRLTKRKGLIEFVCHSLPLVVEKYPATTLLVIGDEAPDALSGALSGGKAAVTAIAGKLGLSGNLRFLNPCDDIELSRAYYAANVHIFPVREIPGDVEGFGMVAIEAAAHGLPTVAFAAGGVPDAVNSGKSGYLITAGNYTEFSEKIICILGLSDSSELKMNCKQHAASMTWEIFVSRVQKHFIQTIGIDE